MNFLNCSLKYSLHMGWVVCYTCSFLMGSMRSLSFISNMSSTYASSEVARLTLFDPVDYNLPGPPSMGFSRQEEYWSGLPFPSPRDLPDPGIEPGFPALWAAL